MTMVSIPLRQRNFRNSNFFLPDMILFTYSGFIDSNIFDIDFPPEAFWALLYGSLVTIQGFFKAKGSEEIRCILVACTVWLPQTGGTGLFHFAPTKSAEDSKIIPKIIVFIKQKNRVQNIPYQGSGEKKRSKMPYL